jgi:1-acyl-sn-glycerol-3-phosphate acyltransferase
MSNESRDALIDAILTFLVGQDLLTRAEIKVALEREIEGAGADALVALKARLVDDAGWDYYPRDPLARSIHHFLADRFLDPGSRVIGAEHLRHVARAPLVIVANHLSYADANVVDLLLERGGGAEVANRLTAMAGPKIFTSRERRFSGLCFGTIKVPQSAEVSTGDAVLSQREVAKAARRAIEVARDRLAAGDALLLFGEGTRSRSGGLQPMLPGVARYLDVPGTWVLPVGLSGPEALFPVEHDTLRPSKVVVHLGAPIRADALVAAADADRRLIMDAIGLAVAELVPPEYRGVYADPGQFPDAKTVIDRVRSAPAEPGR